jgi:hypothetical protein
VTWRNSHNEDPRMNGATLRRLVEQATWRPKLCTPVVNLVPIAHYLSSQNRKLEEIFGDRQVFGFHSTTILP